MYLQCYLGHFKDVKVTYADWEGLLPFPDRPNFSGNVTPLIQYRVKNPGEWSPLTEFREGAKIPEKISFPESYADRIGLGNTQCYLYLFLI